MGGGARRACPLERGRADNQLSDYRSRAHHPGAAFGRVTRSLTPLQSEAPSNKPSDLAQLSPARPDVRRPDKNQNHLTRPF